MTSKPDRKPGEEESEKPTSKSDAKQSKKTVVGSSQQNDGGDKLVDSSNTIRPKLEKDRSTQPPMSRPVMEENIVLGVALEGSKRTLPIEEEMVPSSVSESKDLATSRSVIGSPSYEQDKNSQLPNASSAKSSDQKDPQG